MSRVSQQAAPIRTRLHSTPHARSTASCHTHYHWLCANFMLSVVSLHLQILLPLKYDAAERKHYVKCCLPVRSYFPQAMYIVGGK